MPAVHPPVHASRSWWQRTKSADGTLSAPPSPQDVALRHQRSFPSLPDVEKLPPPPPMPPPPKRPPTLAKKQSHPRLSNLASAIGLKSKKHPPLAIQDPPSPIRSAPHSASVPTFPRTQPPPLPPLPSYGPKPAPAARAPPRSLASAHQSWGEDSEPRTPSDSPNERRSYQHSVMTLDGDPFATVNAFPLPPDSAKLFVFTDGEAKEHAMLERPLSSGSSTQTYHSATSGARSQFPSPLSAQAFATVVDLTPVPSAKPASKPGAGDFNRLSTPEVSQAAARPTMRPRGMTDAGAPGGWGSTPFLPRASPPRTSPVLSSPISTVPTPSASPTVSQPHSRASSSSTSRNASPVTGARPVVLVRQASSSRLQLVAPPSAPPSGDLPPPPMEDEPCPFLVSDQVSEGSKDRESTVSLLSFATTSSVFSNEIIVDSWRDLREAPRPDSYAYVQGRRRKNSDRPSTANALLPASRARCVSATTATATGKMTAREDPFPTFAKLDAPVPTPTPPRVLRKSSSHSNFPEKEKERAQALSISIPTTEELRPSSSSGAKAARKQRSFTNPLAPRHSSNNLSSSGASNTSPATPSAQKPPEAIPQLPMPSLSRPGTAVSISTGESDYNAGGKQRRGSSQSNAGHGGSGAISGGRIRLFSGPTLRRISSQFSPAPADDARSVFSMTAVDSALSGLPFPLSRPSTSGHSVMSSPTDYAHPSSWDGRRDASMSSATDGGDSSFGHGHGYMPQQIMTPAEMADLERQVDEENAQDIFGPSSSISTRARGSSFASSASVAFSERTLASAYGPDNSSPFRTSTTPRSPATSFSGSGRRQTATSALSTSPSVRSTLSVASSAHRQRSEPILRRGPSAGPLPFALPTPPPPSSFPRNMPQPSASAPSSPLEDMFTSALELSASVTFPSLPAPAISPGGLPPPPRRRPTTANSVRSTTTQHFQDIWEEEDAAALSAGARRMSIVHILPLPPPPRRTGPPRRPATATMGDRRMSRKPSFLDIGNDMDDDVEEIVKPPKSAGRPSRPPTMVVDDSFLDLGRGQSLDIRMSLDGHDQLG